MFTMSAYHLADKASLDPLIAAMGSRQVVMLGEASHGTHEYYTWRTAISKRLIEEHGFRFIAVEGDWPDCYRINRYVKGYADAGDDIHTVLAGFDRWPSWMWANWETAALAEWLREYNRHLHAAEKIGFYGLDVYSLWDSMRAMMEYLEKEDKEAVDSVKKAIACFEPFGENEQLYARQSFKNNCRSAVVALLKEIRSRAQFLDGDREAGFNTEQNALIAVNAEKYYSNMIGFNNDSWNIRDRHMMETLQRLMQFHSPAAKAIVWEHNTHIGDARATDMKTAGMINTGQLAREAYGSANVFLAGFSSYEGTVIAGEEWGAPMEEMELPPAAENSIEAELHDRYGRDVYFICSGEKGPVFHSRIPHRAVGVVYHPGRERKSNYVPSVLAKRYDALLFIDHSHALHPLQPHIEGNKVPETYPFGS